MRHACRDAFREAKLLARILSDIDMLLGIGPEVLEQGAGADSDGARPEPYWTPDREQVLALILGGVEDARDDPGKRADVGAG